ncbi:FeoB-associated Cys-rich membrane protein [Pedobacter hartonius]|uniref:LPXTG-motif cell wall anchor domain-containing protein n=1 Tax=Pedobacter hartonius TaxID=425514 RepID=A0A1H3XGW3_9SPHI|nr:FeoB-associated Cys-rich membrane protein [Pedobacter hartonius]SDZ97904.1 LPXTG-motif cell wall anchor domain-containing protein [Pedobacter hartonius]
MNINYPIAGIVLLAMILLVFFLIRRNRKDEKTFEKEMSESELKSEKHKEDQH